MKNENFIKIKYEGLNWNYFQNQALSLGVKFHNLSKTDYKNITFSLSRKDYLKITKNEKFKNYKLQIIEYSGFQKLKHNFFTRLGAYIGIILMLASVVSVSQITMNFNIYGLNKIAVGEVEDKLREFGIMKGKVNNFKNDDLENYLLATLKDVSMVSVMQKGNTICINIKEKESQIITDYQDLISPYNIIIKSINVVSGTPLYKEGDVVTAGKTLVGAYTIIAGNKISCSAVATITAEAWWVGSVNFEKEKTLLSRTGKKTVCRTISWNDNVILGSVKESPYERYEIAHYEGNISDNFLPLKYNTTTYYECEEKVVKQNFDESRDILLHESRLLAYNKVPEYIKITNEEQKIISHKEEVLVQTYLTAIVEIKNVGQ